MNDDFPEIPDFLKRSKNEPRVTYSTPATVYAMPVKPDAWERIKQQKKEKARGRIAKMKARMADKEAIAAGKTWDTVNGGWR